MHPRAHNLFRKNGLNAFSVFLTVLALVAHFYLPLARAEVAPIEAGEASSQAEKPAEESNEIDTSDRSANSTSTKFLSQNSPLEKASVSSQSAVTSLPGLPDLSTFQSNGSVTVRQLSSSRFRMNYSLRNPGSFGGVVINWGVTPKKKANLDSFDTFSFEMRLNTNQCLKSGKRCLKVEFVDTSNHKAVANVSGLSTTFKEVRISKAHLRKSNLAIDFTRIKQINFVIDNEMARPDDGTLEVKTSGLSFTPTVAGTDYDPGALTEIPGEPILNASKHDDNHNSKISLNQTSPRDFQFSYRLTDASDFVFVWEDFRGLRSATAITLAAEIPTGKRMRVEVKDVNGKVADFFLTGSGVKKNYTLKLTGDGIPPGFLTDSLKEMVYVVSQGLGGNKGTIAVERKGLDFVPVLTGLPFDDTQITLLPNKPSLGAGGGGNAPGIGKIISQPSPDEFNFRYNLTPSPSAFAFAFIPFANEEGESLPEELVMGVKGPAGAKVKMEVKDVNGRVADFILKLDGTLKNFVLTLTGDNVPVDFDRTHIHEIVLVADRGLVGTTGFINLLNVRTRGLDFIPVIGPDP